MKQQVVLITGAARGIGASTARALVAQGARVFLVGLEPERIAQLSEELGAAWIEGDVTDPAAMERAVAEALRVYSRIDCVIANAGIAHFSPLVTVEDADFRKVMDVNFFGVWNIMRAALPALIESRGYFLGVASGAAAIPLLAMNAYSPSKAATEALCDTLRGEVAHRGVDVGVAYFTFIDTDMVAGAKTTISDSLGEGLPAWLRKAYPVESASEALVEGIRRRRARIVFPGKLRWFLAFRWLINRLVPYGAKASMRKLDSAIAQNRKNGKKNHEDDHEHS